MMEETKKWWESTAIWGAVVALLGGLAGIFGYSLGPDDQEVLTSILASVAGTVGSIIAIWGRVKASKTISS